MNIDWSQLITKSMKDLTAQAAHLVEVKAELSLKNVEAVTQITRIQDRIDTLGYGIEAEEATTEDQSEQAALVVSLKEWKVYKYLLGKVTLQANWPSAPEWPVKPVIPKIAAAPMPN